MNVDDPSDDPPADTPADGDSAEGASCEVQPDATQPGDVRPADGATSHAEPADDSPQLIPTGPETTRAGPPPVSASTSAAAPASPSTSKGFSSSPYPTGGGGTVLEHTLGARVLVALLTGAPAPMLGEDVTVTSVLFQRSDISALDDLVIIGEAGDGSERRVAVGVRRAPAFSTSDEETEVLLRSYLKVLFERWDEVADGSCRLGLAVASPSTPGNELATLAEIAGAAADAAGFRNDVAASNRTTIPTRNRLTHLDALVAAARAHIGPDNRPETDAEVTYAFLCGLRVHWMQLEGVTDSDKAIAVSALAPHLVDPATAPSVFGRLEALSSTYAPSATWATPAKLRRDMQGFGVGPGRAYQRASGVLSSLAQSLQTRTRFGLPQPGGTDLELPRTEPRAALTQAVRAASEKDGCLVVHGEPDVGKSALALRATQDLREGGATVTVLSLRDVHDNLIGFEAASRARFATVLADAPTGQPRVLLIDGAEAALEGKADMLGDLAAAAVEAGHTVVAVTRNDARSVVSTAMATAMSTANAAVEPDMFPVDGLDATESAQVVDAFTTLGSLLATGHASWIAARPGLVELLLQAGPISAPTTRAMCEADVLSAVWGKVVRRDEQALPGAPGPDARDQTMVAFARRRLAGGSPASGSGSIPGVDLQTLPSLRSDALLVSRGGIGWLQGDDFGSDLVADMALAVLLHREGFAALDGAGAPRWTIRAARMAAQLVLTTAPDPGIAWTRLLTAFDALAATHGSRWSEIPLEALLTIPSADQLLDALRATILAAAPESSGSIDNAIRLALQTHTTRFTEGNEVPAERLDHLAPGTARLRTILQSHGGGSLSRRSAADSPRRTRRDQQPRRDRPGKADAVPPGVRRLPLRRGPQDLRDRSRDPWQTACSPLASDGPCRHRLVWDTLLTVLDHAGLSYLEGPYGEVTRTAIPAPYPQSLTMADPGSFDSSMLAPLLKASTVAAQSEACVSTDAAPLSSALLDACVRSLVRQTEHPYDVDDAEPAAVAETPIASAVTSHTTDASHDVLRANIHALTVSPRALDMVLRSVAKSLTYNPAFTEHVPPIARTVLTTVLDAVAADPLLLKDDWSDWAIAAILLTPGIRPEDRSPDDTLDAANDRWFTPADLGDLLGRWTTLAAGEPRAVDTAVYLTRRLDPVWRASEGLQWMEQLINGQFDDIANATLLGNWLTNLRSELNTPAVRAVFDEPCWHRIVDGLAAAGDSTARTLQAADE